MGPRRKYGRMATGGRRLNRHERRFDDPDGNGIVAVANEDDAKALAFDQEDAMVLTFNDLLIKLEAGELMLGMGH